MKKKLLLALMALLPLVGWATDVTVTLYDFTIPYGAEPTAATLKAEYPSAVKVQGAEWDDIKGYLTFARVNDGSANWNSNNVGVYSWTLTKALDTGAYTIYLSSNNAKLTIEKATITETVPGTKAADCTYASLANPLQLVTAAPRLSLAEAESTIEYSLDGESWSTTKPSIKKVGNHTVYYRVPGTSNWNAKASAPIGTVKITGTYLVENTDYTAPALVGDALTFQWDAVNGKAVEQTLITAGTTPTNHGTLYYSVDGGAWSTELPTASAAGNHTVSWKVVGKDGYYDVAPADLTAKNIAKVTPTVTAAKGASGLVWTGEELPLLSEAGTATFGATPKYLISTNGGADWSAATAYADVKGQNAGDYLIKTLVPGADNYNESYALTGDDHTVVTVTIAGAAAFTAAPTAADLTWNNGPQNLIVPGANTVAGKVQYSVDGGAYSTAIPQGTEAKDYTVTYKVVDPNYADYNVVKTIEDVKINKKVMSIKVNNVKKTYDGGVTLFAGDDAALDGATEKFTFIGRIADGLSFAGVNYAALDAANKNAGTHTDVLTIATATLTAISNNYDYTIIPGTLTVEKKALTVTANQPLSAVYHDAYNISNEYTITPGYAAGENIDNVFTTKPVLTTNAAATNPEPADYTIAFTEGVLVANPNYTVTYVIPDNAKFTVTPDPASKIVITVLPKTYTYGDTEDYTNLVAGTDYYVTGLIGDDVLTKAPTFRRSDASNKNVGIYDLIAENIAVADPSKYPGGYVYNNSTVTIEPAEITVTVNDQTVVTGTDAAALEQLDQDAWSVTGLVYDDTKASLKGAVANMLTPKADAAAAPGTVDDGIQFAFDNANYVLATSPVTGKLIVIAADALALDCSKADNATKIAAQGGNDMGGVTINFTARNGRELPTGKARVWKANTWNTLVLPFNITVAELSQKLGYAIVNVIDPSRTTVSGTSSKFYGKLTMKGANDKDYIPANTPFMVKTADDIDGIIDFGPQTIVAPASADDLSVDAGGGAKLTGTYTTKEVSGADNAEIWFLMGNSDSWAYIGAGKDATWNILPFEAFIDMSSSSASSFTFYFEELDGSVTAIKSVEAEGADDAESAQGTAAEGWYTINGIKLNAKPTQKGIYIYNGKKIAIQ